MRTFLFISELGSSIGIARKVQESGNKVYFYTNNNKFATVGNGLVDKVDINEPLFYDGQFSRDVFNILKSYNPDCVIFDFNFDAAHTLKIEFEKAGIPSYGSSILTKTIKNNPAHMAKILTMSGIMSDGATSESIPLTYSITYNARKVQSTSIFFEYTYLMNDDLGPTACMGSIGYHGNTETLDNKIKPFTDLLIQSNYSGKMDLFLRIHQDKIWCEGISFYFNPNTIYAFFENLSLNPADFLYQLAMNQEGDIKFKSAWSCQISCGVPPFPYDIETKQEKEVTGIDSGVIKHMWITDLEKDGQRMISCPLNGNIFSVSSRGDFIREAKRRAYRTLSNIRVDDLMFRTDIGHSTADTCRLLRQWNWLNISDEELVEPFVKNQAAVLVG